MESLDFRSEKKKRESFNQALWVTILVLLFICFVTNLEEDAIPQTLSSVLTETIQPTTTVTYEFPPLYIQAGK